MYGECNCCAIHIAKATDRCVLKPRLHLSRGTSANWLTFFILCLRRQHASTAAVTAAIQSSMPVSNLHEVFEGGFEVFPPSVRGTPSPATHSKGLLLRVGASPCGSTNNRGVVQHVIFNCLGLAQPHECSSKAATCHANSTVQAAHTSI